MEFKARCHCGRVRFSFRSPPIKAGRLWNEKVLYNYFCKFCGVFTYIGDGENARDGYRVNLGCVEGIDSLALDISIIDGNALPVVGAGVSEWHGG
ncbi:MAG: glutathione-dependent formaldehyde-activating protein [Steroidobacteraceae bacterium]|jgi:hypothetical protein